MGNEKRQYPRVEISWPVTVISADCLVSCRTENLSLVGTLIRCSELPELLYDFRLIFRLADRRLLLATAERVWSRTFVKDKRMSHAMGVRFTFIPDQDYHLMSKEISQYI
jgi:hypothetical protein